MRACLRSTPRASTWAVTRTEVTLALALTLTLTLTRCELLERRVKEEAAPSGAQSSRSLQLRLGDGRGASVEAYLDLAKVGVPAGLLVGARLQLPPEPYP